MIAEVEGIAAYLEAGGLEKEWRNALGSEIKASLALGPVSVDLLSQGELARYRRLADPDRRRGWLTGRAALKRLLRRLDLNPDTSRLEFPAAGISLSHAGGIALAVAGARTTAGSSYPEGLGLGVDIETDRPMRLESARFFLSPKERADLFEPGDGRERALLRAWTIKEAVFKADLGNRGRLLADYRLGNAAARKGTAFLETDSGTAGRFRYLSQFLAGWHISVAVRAEESPHG